MVVHGRRGSRAVLLFEDMLRLPPFEIVAPSSAEMTAAYAAFALYGKGSGHPAWLNFGDLFSYALAKTRGVPLLFKGDDFSQTDLSRASRSRCAALADLFVALSGESDRDQTRGLVLRGNAAAIATFTRNRHMKRLIKIPAK